MSKPRIVKDYEKLSDEVVEQLKIIYPYGFTKHLVVFKNKEGELKKGLPFETEDYYYLIRMTEQKALNIVEEDEDYDDDGILKKKVRSKFEDKYEDDDFIKELNSNDDNELGFDDEEDSGVEDF